MFEIGEDCASDHASDRALRAGLHDLPTPDISADFDVRIQFALQQRPSWWQPAWAVSWWQDWRRGSRWQDWWRGIRPAFPVAAGTLTVTLLLLRGMQNAPIAPLPVLVGARSAAQTRLPLAASAISQAKGAEPSLENSDLNYASLSFFGRLPRRIPDKSG